MNEIGSLTVQTTPLIASLADQIVAHIRTDKLAEGDRLVERKLAEQFRVSRSPVRNAMKLLHDIGVLKQSDGGGYMIADVEAAQKLSLESSSAEEDEKIYLTIADDRLHGRLPERITESEFLRRYDLTKGRLSKILLRMANEGWIERLPGNGWAFLPVLTSLQAYEDSYRFRLLIEPAALLEPTFKLNRPTLLRCREEQQWLVDGGIWTVSDAKLFELNSGMHEAIIECCQNSFFIESLKRLDRLRRLIDYRQMLDRQSARERSREHLQLLDLILAGKNQEASRFMAQHLEDLSRLKTVAREVRG
ncbi:GntR family transcriptional regulator [Rhizobium sp. J15]|uniref:GntR family transcriptional regulator n=1 Tax=Rhizobium sp. J15 TaxID=2035450 RepID=UPI000BE9085C|nr:GntR family transcriptional regulator [Rhizobium sp. J15]PDT18282.1 GntR family transcriptional regulator [Rhizobium sp. J15]